MSIPQQSDAPEVINDIPPPEDAQIAATVDFLMAHAGLTPSDEERASLIRAYTRVAPLLMELHAAPAARYAEPAPVYVADPAGQ